MKKKLSRYEYLKKKIKKMEKKFDNTPKAATLARDKIMKRSAKLLAELEELTSE